jgi:hypothetical protein
MAAQLLVRDIIIDRSNVNSFLFYLTTLFFGCINSVSYSDPSMCGGMMNWIGREGDLRFNRLYEGPDGYY